MESKTSIAGLELKLFYEQENDLFVISFFEQENALFEIKMIPENFEKMTYDMVRVIKNYNLYQAQQFQKKLEQEARGEKL